MLVKSVTLKNFKKFKNKTVSFVDPESGIAKPLVLLVGENGCGKTTILQAIAAALGEATSRIEAPSTLDWPGFDLELAGMGWRLPLEVTIEMSFQPDEIAATREYFEKTAFAALPTSQKPAGDSDVKLTLKQSSMGTKVEARDAAQYFQFRGREYAKQIVKADGYGVFDRVGSVFWYTEHRSLFSLTREKGDRGPLVFDDSLLRKALANFQQFHTRIENGDQELREGYRDLYCELEGAFQRVFPKRHFEGIVPRPAIDDVFQDPWFFLTDEKDSAHAYEISEMSAGERSVFAILFDFVNWRINRSVILIDELELHLHPPLQQAFLRALPHLGKENQFIITTHSDWIASIVDDRNILRVEVEP